MMGDTMLIGVLRMPVEVWSDDPLDQHQRQGRYVQAAERIEADAARIAELEAEVERLRKALALNESEWERPPLDSDKEGK